jgi:hypothetical protein
LFGVPALAGLCVSNKLPNVAPFSARLHGGEPCRTISKSNHEATPPSQRYPGSFRNYRGTASIFVRWFLDGDASLAEVICGKPQDVESMRRLWFRVPALAGFYVRNCRLKAGLQTLLHILVVDVVKYL